MKINAKVILTIVNTSPTVTTNVPVKVSGPGTAVAGAVKDFSYDLNWASPLSTAYLGMKL